MALARRLRVSLAVASFASLVRLARFRSGVGEFLRTLARITTTLPVEYIYYPSHYCVILGRTVELLVVRANILFTEDSF